MGQKAFHGGASFGAIGTDFQTLELKESVIDADVLDAWYPPSPQVIAAIQPHLEWLMKTSPPTHGEGLIAAISTARGLSKNQIMIGAGTSALMFTCIPQLLSSSDTALILDPMYGEYSHLVEHVVGATLRRTELDESTHFRPDPSRIAADASGCKMVFLVNPNSPTGVGMTLGEVEHVLMLISKQTLVWIDETYIDYMPNQTCEGFVAKFPNLIICKSMSKFYGLSGLRIGYMVAAPGLIEKLSRFNPPWSVGLLSQVAAVAALSDSKYYETRRVETIGLRDSFTQELATIPNLEMIPSSTNFLMFKLINGGAEQLILDCRAKDVWLRNCDSLSPRFQNRYVRVAVKSREHNRLIVAAIREAHSLDFVN